MYESDHRLMNIVDELAGTGWSVCDDFFEESLWRTLAGEGRRLHAAGQFTRAGIGSGAARRIRSEVRGDYTLWLDPDHATTAQRVCLARLEELRQTVNRELFMGLRELEAHLALYPPGAFYRRHLDQFQRMTDRQLTVVCYLNTAWVENDGGALRIYLDDSGAYHEVLPVGGRLVTFLSARFPHEVLPSRRERMSVTGWFKRRE